MSAPLRMRVFAGPNGSGKSTVIGRVRNTHIGGHPIDFGTYVNADDIARELASGKGYAFATQQLADPEALIQFANASGLLGPGFTLDEFSSAYEWNNDRLVLRDPKARERVAQIVAQFLYDRLLTARQRFSFETVFSHPSKLSTMKTAAAAGYKVYLYFVSTESPDINVERVAIRVHEGGHNVPEDKIRERYHRSLDQLYDAVQLAYHGFLFDNSGRESVMFAEFKRTGERLRWTVFSQPPPRWFERYYVDKQPKQPK